MVSRKCSNLFLKKIDNSEESYHLLYLFTLDSNPNWKENSILSLIIKGHQVPKQGELSDYEYFKLLKSTHKKSEDIPSNEYLLIEEDKPITSVYIMERAKGIFDISFLTLPNYRRKGYATKALMLIEEILFSEDDVLFTTISDISKTKISSMIAKNQGYIYLNEENIFAKFNPNKNMEESQKKILNNC